MGRWILLSVMMVELVGAWPCAGQPVSGGADRGLIGVDLRQDDGQAIDGERNAVGRGKMSDEARAAARKRAEALKPGVMIVGLRKGGPAEQAGLKVEDVITAANGKPVITLMDLQRALRELRPGG